MKRQTATRNDEGAALVLALCLMLIASVIGGSLMMLSQAEAYSSLNYRSMTQARYSAESGVHKAINYLLNSYDAPGDWSDPISNYNMTVSPVTYNGAPVILSATSGVSSNYPDASTRTAFAAAAQGSLSAGGSVLQYTASAKLISMQQIFQYGSSDSTVVQTWEITGTGTTGGTRPATVEVTAVLERQAVAFNMYGLFAVAQTCGALTLGGGVVTDSYDSTHLTMSSGAPVTDPWGGSVGTNGNLTEGGGSIVKGNLATPRPGVGHCSDGAVTGYTGNGNAQLAQGVVQLPQAVAFPTPDLPDPLPPTTNNNLTGTDTCASAGFAAAICSGSPGNLTLDAGGGDLYYGDVKLTGGSTLHFKAGTYNLNSISLAGNSTVIIDSGPVVFDVVGQGKNTPIDFSGGSISNASFMPQNFQIIYAGNDTVKVSGGSQTALMVFAPRSDLQLVGGSSIYGSILGKTISDQGGTAIHYDRNLPEEFAMSFNTMLTSFSWKKY